MDRILIPWSTGNGNIVLEKQTDGITVIVSSDTINESSQREQILTFVTEVGSVSHTITVIQKGKEVILK